MANQTDIDALEKRLKKLEAENAQLRQSSGGRQPVTVREDMYLGNPILNFEGPFRPFSLGLTKLKAIKACSAEVDAFLEKHQDSKAEPQQIRGRTKASDRDTQHEIQI